MMNENKIDRLRQFLRRKFIPRILLPQPTTITITTIIIIFRTRRNSHQLLRAPAAPKACVKRTG